MGHYVKKGRPVIRVKKKCWTCAKEFEVIASRAVKQKYCSPKCAQQRGLLGILEDWEGPLDDKDQLPFKRFRRRPGEQDQPYLNGYDWSTVSKWLIELSERYVKKQLYLESRRGKYS